MISCSIRFQLKLYGVVPDTTTFLLGGKAQSIFPISIIVIKPLLASNYFRFQCSRFISLE